MRPPIIISILLTLGVNAFSAQFNAYPNTNELNLYTDMFITEGSTPGTTRNVLAKDMAWAIHNLQGLPHVFKRIQDQKPVRVWTMGDSVSAGTYGGLAQSVFDRSLTSTAGYAGGMGPSAYLNFDFYWDSKTTATQNSTNNWWGEYQMSAGACITNLSGRSNFIHSDCLSVFYLKGPDQGVLTVKTNGGFLTDWGTLGTVDCFSPSYVGGYTKFAVPEGDYCQQFVAATTNVIFGAGMELTNTPGIRFGYLARNGSEFADWAYADMNILGPILDGFAADLTFIEVKDGPAVSNTFPWVATNVLRRIGGDVVLIGTTPSYLFAFDEDRWLSQNAYMQQHARTYGYAYFDGWSPMGSTNIMLINGWFADSLHPNAAAHDVRACEFIQQFGWPPQLLSSVWWTNRLVTFLSNGVAPWIGWQTPDGVWHQKAL